MQTHTPRNTTHTLFNSHQLAHALRASLLRIPMQMTPRTATNHDPRRLFNHYPHTHPARPNVIRFCRVGGLRLQACHIYPNQPPTTKMESTAVRFELTRVAPVDF